MRSRILRSGARRGRPVRAAVVLGTMVVVVLTALPASGHHFLWHEDADDVSSSFDIRGVRLFRKSDPSRGVVRARTSESIDLFQGPLVSVYFDSRGGSRADRSVSAVFDGGSSGFICLGVIHLKRDEHIGNCELRHADRMWQISFEWATLDATKHVRWWVTSSAIERDDPDFQDRAPDAESFEH